MTNAPIPLLFTGLLAASLTAQVQFKPVEYPVEGPSHLYKHLPVVLAHSETEDVVFYAALGTSFKKDGETLREVFIVEFGPASAIVRQKIFSEPAFDVPVSAADLDNDGFDELFILPREPRYQRAFEFSDGRYVPMEMPFPKVPAPVPAWMDINADDYPDLVLFGDDPDAKVRKALVFINKEGRLFPNGTIEVPELVDSTQTIDINEDGRDELLVYPRTGFNRVANVTRVFRVRSGALQEIESPLFPTDVFLGVTAGFTSVGDINRDGRMDLFMTGFWHSRLGLPFAMVYLQMPPLAGNLRFDCAQIVPESELLEPWSGFGSRHVLEDFDSDGDADLLLWDIRGGVACLENRAGTFHLLSPDQWLPKDGSTDIEFYGTPSFPADFNADGKLDLLTFANSSGEAILLVNVSTPVEDDEDKHESQ